MTNQEMQNILSEHFPELSFTEEDTEFLNVTVDAAKLRSLATFLQENEALSFDYLFCLTGVDWGEDLGVIYHLKSTRHDHILVVRVRLSDRSHTEVDTVSDLWRTAELHEREAYDLFGIHFTNHPDLRRLFLTDDWEGWPMRKDYEDEVNIIEL